MTNSLNPLGRYLRGAKRRLRDLTGRASVACDVPERFMDIAFLAQFQADILRQVWRSVSAEDPEFRAITADLGSRRWAPKSDRYAMLWRLLRSAVQLPGDVIECGVYKGPSARLIGLALRGSASGKRLFLADTFNGLPPPTPGRDGKWKEGDLNGVTLREVQEYLSDLQHVTFLPGLFSETFPTISGEWFCFSHIDCDLWKSVKDCCEFLYPRTVAGGYLVFDDYGVPYCPGARAAVDEFFVDKPEQVIYLPTGQSFVIKRDPVSASSGYGELHRGPLCALSPSSGTTPLERRGLL